MLVKCDGENSCGSNFRVGKLEVEVLEQCIEKTYFLCPHCKKEFVAFYTDKSIRRKQAKIRKLKDIIATKKLKDEIGKDMTNLKKVIETVPFEE